jgi:hypothetical protein
MLQTPTLHCDCCGLSINPQAGEDCPRCGYPISLAKEERFLSTAISDLERVATHGGANLTVASLIARYQTRLSYLQKVREKASVVVNTPTVHASSEVVSRVGAGFAPALEPQPAAPAIQSTPVSVGPSLAGSLPGTPRRTFSLAAFFVDNAITIIGLLGAFLILIGTLSFVYSNVANPLTAFLVIFAAHVIFGIIGVIAYRFPNFRLIARIYIIIYALLLPLTGFAGYSLIQGSFIHLSIPTLIAIAAAYAAIVYALLAIYQGSAPFGYLAAVALAVVDLALAREFHLAYWWWPGTLMLIALPALVSIMHSSNRQLFAGRLSVLRDPTRVLMFTIIGAVALGIVITALYSFQIDSIGGPVRDVRFSILSTTLLLLLWTSLFFWLTRRTKSAIILAFLFLTCVLAACYVLNFEHIGYALALTGVALLYHGLNRFAGRLLQPFGKLGQRLDQLALLLVAFVPLISEPTLPLRLLSQGLFNSSSGLPALTTLEMVGELIAVGVSVVLSLSIAFSRAGLQPTPGVKRNAWPWVLLLSGLLLNAEYSVIVLALHLSPVWCFLALTLVLMAGTVVVRRRLGSYWANPLDLLAIAEITLTLILSLAKADIVWSLLLVFAALTYAILLYQHRQEWLFIPFVLALLALPVMAFLPRLQVLLLMSVILPLAAVVVRRLMSIPVDRQGEGKPCPTGSSLSDTSRVGAGLAPALYPRFVVESIFGWEWPLLINGLLSGIIITSIDITSSASTLHNWLGVSFPVALELASFALTWYIAASLTRIKWWLFPVIGFAIVAVLLPSNSFWALLGVTFVAAALALGVSHFAGRVWASPLYIVILLAAIMTGIAGHTQDHLLYATTWVLLAFALLFYTIGVVEDWTPALWMILVFASWSLVDSAALLGDLYRPPIVFLFGTTIGVTIGLLKLFAHRQNKFVRYILPFYVTSLIAAALTGIYGALAGIDHPFPGAVPIAMSIYTLVAFAVMLYERRPEILVISVGLAAWAIALTHWALWQMMIAYSILCMLTFTSQFIWKLIPPLSNRRSEVLLPRILGLGGQALLVLCIIVLGGLSPESGLLAHVGVGALFVLALFLFWYGHLQSSMPVQCWCSYAAGALISLMVPWELLVFRQTNLELLTLAPASYLTMLGAFLVREAAYRRAGHIVSMLGAVLLLLPTLWLSFGDPRFQLLYTMILLGESLVLLVLGLGLRVRIFVLSGASLVVVGALHALFLSTSSTPLALTGLGVILLLIATGLALARHRLQAAWARWQ